LITCTLRIPNNNQDVEELELEFIDFGAVTFADEDGILIYAPFGRRFGTIQKN
jgi:hypothetical protein